MAMFLFPMVFDVNAATPIPILKLPDVFPFRASFPKAKLYSPVVLLYIAAVPIAVF